MAPLPLLKLAAMYVWLYDIWYNLNLFTNFDEMNIWVGLWSNSLNQLQVAWRLRLQRVREFRMVAQPLAKWDKMIRRNNHAFSWKSNVNIQVTHQISSRISILASGYRIVGVKPLPYETAVADGEFRIKYCLTLHEILVVIATKVWPLSARPLCIQLREV